MKNYLRGGRKVDFDSLFQSLNGVGLDGKSKEKNNNFLIWIIIIALLFICGCGNSGFNNCCNDDCCCTSSRLHKHSSKCHNQSCQCGCGNGCFGGGGNGSWWIIIIFVVLLFLCRGTLGGNSCKASNVVNLDTDAEE